MAACSAFQSKRADQDVVVRELFRFAHSVAYIEGLAQQNGFAIEEMAPVVIRQDRDSKIDGCLAVLRRTG